jgi:hypothetical protein
MIVVPPSVRFRIVREPGTIVVDAGREVVVMIDPIAPNCPAGPVAFMP